jgi:hypothetical protein
MHGVVGGIVAAVGVVAAEVDPTKQPVRTSFYVFLVLAGAVILLILSMLRHLRRANQNLGSARLPAPVAPDARGADAERPPTDQAPSDQPDGDGR